MNRPKLIATVVSVVLVAGLVGGAVLVTKHGSAGSKTATNADPNKIITQAELAAADGKSGHRCFVAVDSVVYEIVDSPLWQNGQHTTSGGLAYCGADMSQAIKQSPHGKSKLAELTIVGHLK